MARCFLLDAGLAYTFWGEAVVTANSIQNSLPSSSIERTPYELWYGIKPTLQYIHRFGSKCFVRIQDVNRRKLDPKATEAILVGMDTQSKAYRCLIKNTNKVVISRDVKFVYSQYQPNTLTSTSPTNTNEPTSQHNGESMVEIDITLGDDNSTNQTSTNITDHVNVNSDADNNSVSETDIDNNIESNVDSVNLSQIENQNQNDSTCELCDSVDIFNQSVISLFQCGKLLPKCEPRTYNQALKSDNKNLWFSAMSEEVN